MLTGVKVVIRRTDLVQGAHDLSGTPGLVDAQVGDDVRRLEAGIAGAGREVAAGRKSAVDETAVRAALPDDLRLAAHFGGDGAGEAVAELRGIGGHEPSRRHRSSDAGMPAAMYWIAGKL